MYIYYICICILYIIVLILIYYTDLIYYYVHVWSCCKLVRQLQQEDEVSGKGKTFFRKARWGMKGSHFRFACCRSSSTEGQLSILYSLWIVFGFLKVRIPEHVRKHDHAKCQHEETNLFFVMGVSLGLKKDLRLIHGTDTFSILNLKKYLKFHVPVYVWKINKYAVRKHHQTETMPPLPRQREQQEQLLLKAQEELQKAKWLHDLHVFASLHSRDWRWDMGVSKNSGTPKWSILIGFSIINHPFWGTPIFGNTHMDQFLINFCSIEWIDVEPPECTDISEVL